MVSALIGTNHMWSNGLTGESIEVTESGTYFVMVDAVCNENQVTSNEVVINVLEAELQKEISIQVLDATGRNVMELPSFTTALGINRQCLNVGDLPGG